MHNPLNLTNVPEPIKQPTEDILSCNILTTHHGLTLSPAQAKALAHTRTQSLAATHRVAFDGGEIKKIILAFCDSPYVTKQNYVQTLDELIQVFYHFKNETLDVLGDDELIDIMQQLFNGRCCGSVALLQDKELERIARNIRARKADYMPKEQDIE